MTESGKGQIPARDGRARGLGPARQHQAETERCAYGPRSPEDLPEATGQRGADSASRPLEGSRPAHTRPRPRASGPLRPPGLWGCYSSSKLRRGRAHTQAHTHARTQTQAGTRTGTHVQAHAHTQHVSVRSPDVTFWWSWAHGRPALFRPFDFSHFLIF